MMYVVIIPCRGRLAGTSLGFDQLISVNPLDGKADFLFFNLAEQLLAFNKIPALYTDDSAYLPFSSIV